MCLKVRELKATKLGFVQQRQEEEVAVERVDGARWLVVVEMLRWRASGELQLQRQFVQVLTPLE